MRGELEACGFLVMFTVMLFYFLNMLIYIGTNTNVFN